MNILPKKKWHVRTKENVARVRRDQKKAKEEEERITERAQRAEQEYRVNILRKNAEKRMETMYGVKKSDTSGTETQYTNASGHVNFFADLEEEYCKNYGVGNRDYKLEKKQEQEEYEKKVGILQYLGQGSSELSKEKPWYEKVPVKKESTHKTTKSDSVVRIVSKRVVSVDDKRQKEQKRHKKKHKNGESHKKKHKKKSKHYDQCCSEVNEEDSSSAEENEKKQRIEKLRQERLEREAKERQRIANLAAPTKSVEERKQNIPQYNSQFNPELARQNRVR